MRTQPGRGGHDLRPERISETNLDQVYREVRDVDADPPATELLCRDNRSAATAKWIEHYVPLVARSRDVEPARSVIAAPRGVDLRPFAGTIHFDGKLIRENGRFVPKGLHGLNPENLI